MTDKLEAARAVLAALGVTAEELLPAGEATAPAPDIDALLPLRRWVPQERERYHFIDVDGLVEDTRFFASDTKDILRLAFGNCFRTEEEAEAKRAEIFGW